MTISETDTVDLISQDQQGHVWLVAVAVEEWDDDQLADLIDKLQYYTDLITSGAVAANYPDLAGSPVGISLSYFCDLTPRVQDALAHIESRIAVAEIDLRIEQVEAPEPERSFFWRRKKS